jgi:hypothetical protein
LALASSSLAVLASALTLGAATGVSFVASGVLVAAGAAAVAVAAGAAGFAAGAWADAPNAEMTKAVAMRDCFNIEAFRCMAMLPCVLNPARAAAVYPGLVNLCKAPARALSCAFWPSPSNRCCNATFRGPTQHRPLEGARLGIAQSRSGSVPTL